MDDSGTEMDGDPLYDSGSETEAPSDHKYDSGSETEAPSDDQGTPPLGLYTIGSTGLAQVAQSGSL